MKILLNQKLTRMFKNFKISPDERKLFAKARSAKKNVEQNKGEELLIMNYILNKDGTYTKIKQPN